MGSARLAVNLLAAATLLGAAQAAQSVQPAQPAYRVTVLLPFTPDQGSGVPTLINNRGLVCGLQIGRNYGFCHERGVITELLPLPGDTITVPTGLNDLGQVVGTSYSLDGPAHAVRFVNGVAEPFALATTDSYNVADINNLGQVAGSLYKAPGEAVAYGAWFGAVRELGTLGGPRRIDGASSINDRGQIVGLASKPGTPPEPGDQVAFLYDRGVIRALPTPADYTSSAAKINFLGQVVGSIAPTNGGEPRPVLWEKGAVKVLVDQAGDARDVNLLGQVVGAIHSGTGGFLYHRTTGARNLNTLIDPASGYTIIYPQAINDLRQIVAFACKESLCGPVRLDPVR